MTVLPSLSSFRRGWLLRLAASRRFQVWAARIPFVRRIARAEGAALFDVVAGFVNAQVLMALVELRVLHLLQDGPMAVPQMAGLCAVPPERMQVLLQAGAGLGLLKRHRDGRFGLALRGASLLAVPGLQAMILHHRALYADLADPVAFLRDGRDTQLARFWPYVFGAAGAVDPQVTATYSELMAESQVLVAEDTLRMAPLTGVQRLMDVGGGTGAFLAAVGRAYPQMQLDLFDLPVVLEGARTRLAASGFAGRLALHPGSFRDDPLPVGADAISLVRVLYDHDDSTVLRLLQAVHTALPVGGRLIISEPMSGGAVPDRATDVYFAIYTMAMQTGRTRSAAEIEAILSAAGFTSICVHTGFRPFITSVITARRG
ncbi:Demethylspheroidene O-methyltransferase [Cypionkella aquatica]|uniref:Demethylspheroidene O-methyltransferase n=1 Tax=Cypionkella aquatica TaxID=1756042 RepID=A0AA37TYA9_9RHOB|nr:methyltransferase [Cypionkella aquatica]GLS88814.1 Demethylspheroidene O-methyltransferase [Cypionkella aquatica]